jgi:hypothetical protein
MEQHVNVHGPDDPQPCLGHWCSSGKSECRNTSCLFLEAFVVNGQGYGYHRTLISNIDFQNFSNYNIKQIHLDNGPCFRNGDFLNLMAELKVEVINTSVNNPSAREVAIIKKLLKSF